MSSHVSGVDYTTLKIAPHKLPLQDPEDGQQSFVPSISLRGASAFALCVGPRQLTLLQSQPAWIVCSQVGRAPVTSDWLCNPGILWCVLLVCFPHR